MPLYSTSAPTIEAAATLVETAWGTRPRCVYACAGHSDAHWQLFHPRRMRKGDMPAYTYANGELVMHPECPLLCRK